MPNSFRSYRVRATVAATAMALVMSLPAHAQSILDPSTWFSTGPEGDKQRQDELKKPGSTREYKSRQIGLWLVDSSASLGAVFDSNLYSSAKNAKSATGLQFAPTISGRYSDGGQSTTAYLDGNVRYFSAEDDVTTFGGRLGIGNSLEIQRGTIWKALAQISRSQDDAGAYNATGLGSDASGVYVKPINSNSLFAATSVLSRLDYAQFSGFTSAGVSANLIRFEDADLSDGTTISQKTRDSNAYTATGRIGWNLAPTIYTFVEPSAVFQQSPNVKDSDTTTYRVTAGLGTDRISLVKGEVFAGYARQSFDSISSQNENGGVYGMRITWFPTRDLTVNLAADDSLGATASGAGEEAKIYASRTKTLSGDVGYALDRRINLALRTSFSNVNFSDTGRKDDVVRIGAELTYMVSANLGIRAGYSNVNVNSSDSLNDVSRDVYTIGLNARF